MADFANIKFRSGKIEVIKNSHKLNKGDSVVVNTERGKELATVLGFSFGEQITSETTFERLATNDDVAKEQELYEKRGYVLKTAQESVEKLEIKLKLVDAEYMLDGQKVIISFTCDDRVDFRELVKELASKLKCRIELKQIGARDQAKLVGGIGVCGQVCCCNRFLQDFDKVSVKMAKTQGLSLNPINISGVCGRLMCCLAHENKHYTETLKKMPKLHARVSTPSGKGIVIYNNVLKERCSVRLEGDVVSVEDFALNEIVFEKG